MESHGPQVVAGQASAILERRPVPWGGEPKRVIAISGSPSVNSKSVALADRVLASLAKAGVVVDGHIRLSTVNSDALLKYKIDYPDVAKLRAMVESADGLVISTPVFKAAYSGLLKAGLDVLPQYGLAGKVVLPIGVGGSLAHVLALDYALRPVLQSMAARHVVQSQFVLEADLADPDAELPDRAAEPLAEAIRNFLHSLTDKRESVLLGHPRPHQSS